MSRTGDVSPASSGKSDQQFQELENPQPRRPPPNRAPAPPLDANAAATAAAGGEGGNNNNNNNNNLSSTSPTRPELARQTGTTRIPSSGNPYASGTTAAAAAAGQDEQQYKTSGGGGVGSSRGPVFDMMNQFNPDGPVHHVVRFRQLVNNETPSSWKTTIKLPHGPRQEVVVTSPQQGGGGEAEPETTVFSNFSRVFTNYNEANDVSLYSLNGINEAVGKRGCKSACVIASGPRHGGKSQFVKSTMLQFIKSIFAPQQSKRLTATLSAVQTFKGQLFDLLRVTLEHPKGVYIDPSINAKSQQGLSKKQIQQQQQNMKHEVRMTSEAEAVDSLNHVLNAREQSLHHAKHIASRATAVYTISVRQVGQLEFTRYYFVDLAACDGEVVGTVRDTEIEQQQQTALDSLSSVYRMLSAWNAFSNDTHDNSDITDPLIEQLPFYTDPSMFVQLVTCVSQSAQQQYESFSALELADQIASSFTEREYNESKNAKKGEQQQQQQTQAGERKSSPAPGTSSSSSTTTGGGAKFEFAFGQRSLRAGSSHREGSASMREFSPPTAEGDSASSSGGAGGVPGSNNTSPRHIFMLMEQVEALRSQLRSTELERDSIKRQIIDQLTPRSNHSDEDNNKDPNVASASSGTTAAQIDNNANLDGTVTRGESYPSSSGAQQAKHRKKVTTRDFQAQVVPAKIFQDEHGSDLDSQIEFAIEDVYDQLMRIPLLGGKKGGANAAGAVGAANALELLQMQEAEHRLKLRAQSFEQQNSKMLEWLFALPPEMQQEQNSVARAASAAAHAVRHSSMVSSMAENFNNQSTFSVASAGVTSKPVVASQKLDDIRRANSEAFMEAYRQKRLAGTSWQQPEGAGGQRARSLSLGAGSNASGAAVGADELQAAMDQRDRALDREAQIMKMASSRTLQAERDVKEANEARQIAEEKSTRLARDFSDKTAEYEQNLAELHAQHQDDIRGLQRDLREQQDKASRFERELDEEKSRKESLSNRAARFSTDAQDRIRALEDQNTELTNERDAAQRQLESRTADFKKQIEVLEKELEAVTEDRDGTRRLAEARAAREIAERSERLENELMDAVQQRDAASSRASKLNKEAAEKVENLEKDLEAMTAAREAEVFDLQKQMRESNEKIQSLEDDLRASNAARDTAVSRLERVSTDSNERIKALEKQLSDSNEARQDALAGIHKTSRSAMDQGEQLQKELDSERNQRDQLAARFKKLSHDSADRIKALEDELAETAEQRDNAHSTQAAKIAKAVSDRTQSLEDDLEKVTAQRDNAISKLASSQKDNNEKLHKTQQELLDTESELELLKYNTNKQSREQSDRIARLERDLGDAIRARDIAVDENHRNSRDAAEKALRLEKDLGEAYSQRDAVEHSTAKKERDLNARLANLTAEKADTEKALEAINARAAKQNRENAAKIKNLEEELETSNAEIEKLHKEAKKAASENLNKFRRLELDLEDTQKQRDENAKQAEKLQAENDELSQASRSRDAEREQSKSRELDFAAADEKSAGRVSELERALEDAHEERDLANQQFETVSKQLEETSANLKKQIEDQNKENERLSNKDTESTKHIRELKSTLRALEQESEQFKVDTALQRKIADTEKQGMERRAREEDERKQKKIRDLEAQLATATEESREAEEGIKTFSSQLESTMAAMSALEQERDDLANKVKDLEKNIDQKVATYRQEAQKAREDADNERIRAKNLSEELEKDRAGFEEHRERELTVMDRQAVAERAEKAELAQQMKEKDEEIAELAQKLQQEAATHEETSKALQSERKENAEKRSDLLKVSTAAQQRAKNARAIEIGIELKHLEHAAEFTLSNIAADCRREVCESISDDQQALAVSLERRLRDTNAKFDEAQAIAQSRIEMLERENSEIGSAHDEASNDLKQLREQFDNELSNAIQEATTRLTLAQKAQTAATEKAAESMAKAQRMIEESEKRQKDTVSVASKQLSTSNQLNDAIQDEAEERLIIFYSWLEEAMNGYCELYTRNSTTLWDYLKGSLEALDQSDGDFSKARTERDQLRKELRDMTIRCEKAEAERESLRKALDGAELALDQLQQDKDQLQTSFEKNIDELKKQHEGYTELNSAANDRLAQREMDISGLAKQLEILRRREVTLEGEVDQTKRALDETSKNLDKTTSERETLKNRLKTAESARKEAQTKVQELTNQVAELRDSNFQLSQKAQSASNDAHSEKTRAMKESAQRANALAEVQEVLKSQAAARRELLILSDTINMQPPLTEKDFVNLAPGIIQIRTAATKLLERVSQAESVARVREHAAHEESSRTRSLVQAEQQQVQVQAAENQRLKAQVEKAKSGEHNKVADLQRAVLLLRDKLEQQQDNEEEIDRLQAKVQELEHYIGQNLNQEAEASLRSPTFKGSGETPTSKSSRADAALAAEERQAYDDHIRMLQNDLRESRSEAESWPARCKQLRRDLEREREEHKNSCDKIAQLERENDDLMEKNMQLVEEVHNLEKGNDTLFEKNIDLANELSSSSNAPSPSARPPPSTTSASASQAMQEVQAENARLKEQVKKFEASNKKSSSSSASSADLLSSLQKENATLIRMNDSLAKEVKELQEASIASTN